LFISYIIAWHACKGNEIIHPDRASQPFSLAYQLAFTCIKYVSYNGMNYFYSLGYTNLLKFAAVLELIKKHYTLVHFHTKNRKNSFRKSNQILFCSVFQFSLLSLSVCYTRKKIVFYKVAKLNSKKTGKLCAYKEKKFGRIGSRGRFYKHSCESFSRVYYERPFWCTVFG